MAAGGFGWYRPWLTDLQASLAPSTHKAVAAVLATQERDGVVAGRMEDLVELSSLSDSTVRRAIRGLAEDGWIRRRRARDGVHLTLLPRPAVRSEGPNRTVSVTEQDGQRDHSGLSEGPASPVTGTVARVNASSSTEAVPPVAPKGLRRRDRDRFDEEVRTYTTLLLGEDAHPDARFNVAAAIKGGATTSGEVLAWLARYRSDLLKGEAA